MNLFNLCNFHQISIRFGLGTYIVLKTKEYEFKMNTAIFGLTGPTNQSRPIANLFCGDVVRGSRGRGSEGSHHHQHDFMIFFPTAKAAFIVIKW